MRILFEQKNCVKSVQIWSYFWSVFSCIRSEYRKIRTRKNSVFGHFSCSEGYLKQSLGLKNYLKIIETFRKRLLCNFNCPATLGLKFWLNKFHLKIEWGHNLLPFISLRNNFFAIAVCRKLRNSKYQSFWFCLILLDFFLLTKYFA